MITDHGVIKLNLKIKCIPTKGLVFFRPETIVERGFAFDDANLQTVHQSFLNLVVISIPYFSLFFVNINFNALCDVMENYIK